MEPVQNITVDDRISRTQYQYTLEDSDAAELNIWADRFVGSPEAATGARRHRHRSAVGRPGVVSGDRPGHRVAIWESRRRPSTTRSTTRSVSGRSIRCIRRSISTTWCWRATR
jgi:hypothetical protein